MTAPLLSTPPIDLPLLRRGKVRDVFEVDADHLLIVATDRISAFDHVLGSGIPDKGRILTQLSAFWFGHLAGKAQGAVDCQPALLGPKAPLG